MQTAWFIWSLLLLLIWLVVYLSLKSHHSRKEMLSVSLATSLLGLTEPIFIPQYWNPPSLFNLAQNTGFDIESFLFSFAVGGLAAVIYEWFFPVRHQPLSPAQKHHIRHKFHFWAIISTPLIFTVLYVSTPLNPIYSAIIALICGGLAAFYCRPDLIKKMLISAVIFTGIYFVYFFSLVFIFPDYVEQVWNLTVLSGLLVGGIPLEELLFAASLGWLWSSVYEHIYWYKLRKI